MKSGVLGRGVVAMVGFSWLLAGCGASSEDPAGAQVSEQLATQSEALIKAPLPNEETHRRHQAPFGELQAQRGVTALAAKQGAAPANGVLPYGLPPPSGCLPTHLTRQGGFAMQGDNPAGSNQVTLVPVEWGSAPLGYAMSDVDGFLSTVFTGISPWYVWLKHEYELPNILLTKMKSLTLTAPNAGKTLLLPADIQSEIRAQLDSGALPVSNVFHYVASMLYLIHVPAGIQVSLDGNVGNQLCGGADGHTWTADKACAFNVNVASFSYNGYPVHYAVVPDMTAGTCHSGSCNNPNFTAFQNLTMTESHEIAEALTDPLGGWYDSAIHPAGGVGVYGDGTCGQIGDMCVGIGVDTNGSPLHATVQAMWSNVANTCAGNYGGAVADFQQKSTSAIVLAGDTNPNAQNTVPFVQAGTAQTTNVVLSPASVGADANWMSWQKTGKATIGDYDGDGFVDMALPGSQAGSMPTGSNLNGIFMVSNSAPLVTTNAPPELGTTTTNFTLLAQQTAYPPVTGDFNGDGAADIAIAGGSGWTTIPVAFGVPRNNPLFVANKPQFWGLDKADTGFNALMASSVNKPQLVAGDFDGNGLTDLALVGTTSAAGLGTATITVAYAVSNTASGHYFRGDGSFSVSQITVGAPVGGGAATDFNSWASQPNVKAVAGDFDGDGLSDIALAGGQSWQTVPMAFMRNALSGVPSFRVTNYSTQSGFSSDNRPFAADAAVAGAQLVAGDFDGNGVWDLALTGPSSWNYIGLGMSPSVVGVGQDWGGLYYVKNTAGLANFIANSTLPNVYALSLLHGGAVFSKSAIKIDAGGGAVPPFVADVDFSGGAIKTRTNTISTTGVIDPAPAALYQSQRYNNHSYIVPGFTAGSLHLIRLHWAETKWTAANQRKFNVSINGTQVLTNFDVFAAAGGADKAVVKEFLKPADAAGKFTISFVGTLDAAFIAGIEVQ